MKLLTTASAIALLSATAAFGQDATAVPGDAEADASSFAFIGDVDRNASASTTGSTAQAAIETAFPGAALPIIGIERAAASAGDGIEVDVNGNPVGGGSSGTLNLASSGPANAQLQFQLGNLTLRANKSETFDGLKFTLEGAGERTNGHAFTDTVFAGCRI